MKILGSDFDGTFAQGGLGESKLAAVRAWRERGHKFGLISGRGCEFYQALVDAGVDFDFCATCNGAYVLSRDGAVLYEQCFDRRVLETLLPDLIAWGGAIIYVKSEQYWCVLPTMEERPRAIPEERCYLPERMPQPGKVYQLTAQFTVSDKADRLVEHVREKYGKCVNILRNGNSIDMVPVGVDKAQGLYRVMEAFGASHADVIAVGDNHNDMDMIREFRSYAMANGVEAVRRAASAVVNDVTEILEKEIK